MPDLNPIEKESKLSNGPSAEYIERVSALSGTLKECMNLSHDHAGIRAETSRHFYASVLFTSLISRAASLAVLLPSSPWASKLIEHWDYASVAGIVRTMLEIRIAYYYLCTDDCSDDEWQCRWNTFNLHDCMARKKLFEAMADANSASEFDAPAAELRTRLMANSYFGTLTSGQQKQVLRGNSAYLSPLEDISEKAGLEKSKFRWLYIFLSSHVHSLPMSFYRMRREFEDRGRGVHSEVEEHYTSLCVSLAITFLVRTRDEFRAMFANANKLDRIAQTQS